MKLCQGNDKLFVNKLDIKLILVEVLKLCILILSATHMRGEVIAFRKELKLKTQLQFLCSSALSTMARETGLGREEDNKEKIAMMEIDRDLKGKKN